jgi:hypothetical protein
VFSPDYWLFYDSENYTQAVQNLCKFSWPN